MIDSLVSAGPPQMGLPNLRESRSQRESAEKGTFDGLLEQKVKKDPSLEGKDRFVKKNDEQASDPPQDRVTRSENGEKARIEKKPEKGRELRAEKPEQREGVKAARTREQAIEEFMDSFESELGIPATRLVAAIAELSPSEKGAPPEITAEKVVKGMHLSPEDEQKAQALYANLLQKLNTVTEQQVMPVIAPQQEAQFFAQRQSIRANEALTKKGDHQSSIKSVTSSFWSPQVAAEAKLKAEMSTTLPLNEGGLSHPLLKPQGMGGNLQLQNLGEGELPPELMAEVDSLTFKAETNPTLTALPNKELKKGVPVEELTPFALSGMITKKDRIQNLQENVLEKEAVVPEEASPLAALLQKVTAGESLPNSEFSQQSLEQGSGQEREATKIKLDDTSMSAQMLGEGGEPISLNQLGDLNFEQLISKTTSRAPTEGEQEINNQQLLNQAKALLSKGGGEVKVRMTPEGLGSVQLKVMMQDGKMQIQIQADNKAAKSALESSLADLKTSLAAQKVTVDNIKVDVVNTVGNETTAQNQTNDQGQRESRQFWNNFNEHFGNHARRNSFFESPTGRGYKRNEPQALEPIQASTATPARKIEGKGKGLNLVA
ncbi:MAG: flagellar hook-length control protein FliK [Bdellovibrionia bacterium]